MINLILKNKNKLIMLCTFVLVLGIGYQITIANNPCLSTTGWSDGGTPKTGMPCPLINNGEQSQKKIGDSDIDFTNLTNSSLYTRETASASKIVSTGDISISSFFGKNSKALCVNDNGEIVLCNFIDVTLDSGVQNDTMRYNGVKWVPTSKVQNDGEKISIGFDNTLMPPLTAGGNTPLSINGNIQIKGSNYKESTDLEERILSDVGEGVGKWEKFSKFNDDAIKVIRITKESYPIVGDINTRGDTAELFGAGIKCPASHPIAIGGGGDCPGHNNNSNNISSPINFIGNYTKCFMGYQDDVGDGNVACTNVVSTTAFLDNRSSARIGDLNADVLAFPTYDLNTSNGWLYSCSAVSDQDNVRNDRNKDIRPSIYAICAKAQ